jgi:uncharacterized protein YggE
MQTKRFRHGLNTLAVATMVGAMALGGALGAVNVSAQDASPVPTTDMTATQTDLPTSATIPTVSVSGHGSVDVAPDTAQVTIGVDVTLPTLEEAQAESSAQASAIIDAITATGVDAADVQTSNYSVYVVRNYDQNGNPSEITGYQISNQVNVTIRDVNAVSQVLSAAIDAGANNIWGISFFVDDQTAAASEARVLAVQDARAKAEELAAASGLSVGRVLAIAEGTVSPQLPMQYARASDQMAMGAGAPIEVGTNQVSVDVQITFELTGE